MTFTKLILIICSFLTMLFTACNSDETDNIKVQVTCYGTFSGDFRFNGNSPVSFGGDLTDDSLKYHNTGSLYYWEYTFSGLEYIKVTAVRDYKTDRLEIDLVRDKKSIKSTILDADDANESYADMSIILEYEYGEEETSTSSSTDTSKSSK